MEHQKYEIHWTKQVVLNSRKENGTLSMVNQMQIMMSEMKLSITQKY